MSSELIALLGGVGDPPKRKRPRVASVKVKSDGGSVSTQNGIVITPVELEFFVLNDISSDTVANDTIKQIAYIVINPSKYPTPIYKISTEIISGDNDNSESGSFSYDSFLFTGTYPGEREFTSVDITDIAVYFDSGTVQIYSDITVFNPNHNPNE